MKKFLAPMALVALLACEKELDYEIPDPGKRAVISAQLETGKTLEVFISESVYSLSSEDPKTRNDFQALLYTNDPNSPFEMFVDTYNPGWEPQYVYRVSYDFKENESYRIVVRGEGIPEASVTETVLNKVPFEEISYDRDNKEFKFTIKDSAETKDYYMVTINEFGSDNLWMSSLDLDLDFFEFSEFFGDDDIDGRRYGSRAFLTDESFNGQNREITVRAEGETPAIFVELRFHHISESYYKYELTRSSYNYSDGFFSEPTQIFSNVNNGYGIFATSASSVYKVQY